MRYPSWFRSLSIQALSIALSMVCVVLLNAQTQSVKPNIVILYADDLGYGDVQCNNPERGKIPTPRIDGLAAQGMRFTDGHSSSAVCSPSRYALLTGRYHWRTRLQGGIVGLWGQPLIAAERLTVASLCQQQGYRTACIGKWHLGREWPIDTEQKKYFEGFGGQAGGGGQVTTDITDEHRATWKNVFSQRIPGGPTERGFNMYFGTDVPNWPPYCFIENDRTIGIPSALMPAAKFVKNQASLQGPALPDWQLENILPTLVERAEQFIQQHAQAKQPFLLYMPFTSPHTPLAVNQAWKGKSGLSSDFADLVMETDAAVGRILDALSRAGIDDNTLVLFTSDNGCAPYIGVKELEAQGHYPSGPLRGYKSDAWEGGHRVPFIVRWPGVVQSGSVCSQLIHQADVLRTLADVLKVPLPENAGEDSFSMLPLLTGTDRPIREHAVSTSNPGVPALRNGSWKYIAAPAPAKNNSGVQLYDLSKDLGEQNNLADDQPEKVVEMQKLLEKIVVTGRSTPGEKQANDVRVVRYPKAPNQNRAEAK